MTKKLYLFIPVIVMFLSNIGLHAAEQDLPPSFEEGYEEVGYKSVEVAVKEFEAHFKCKVELPGMVPPISFTHQFGSFFEDKRHRMNDNLSIRFVNKDHRKNIFKIDIRPVHNKITFDGKEYALQYGGKGIYFEFHDFHFYVFDKNGLQYLLGIHQEVSDIDTPDMLARLADSVKEIQGENACTIYSVENS